MSVLTDMCECTENELPWNVMLMTRLTGNSLNVCINMFTDSLDS